METLNLEKFSPKKAELTTMADSYKTLSIKGVDDKVGYAAVDDARKELKTTRCQIEKDGKLLRAEAVTFQKAVISKEKELVGIIKPIEVELEQKQEVINEEKLKIKRRESLPQRIEKLEAIGVSVAEDFLLLMDDAQFFGFFNDENAKYLAEKEIKIKEEQEAREEKARLEKEAEERKMQIARDKIEADRKKVEDDKLDMERKEEQRVAIEKAKKEAIKQAKLDAELKAKQDKEREEKEESDRIKKEKAEQERLEKGKKYREFLAKHEYVDNENFYIQKLDTKIVLFKKVGEFNI